MPKIPTRNKAYAQKKKINIHNYEKINSLEFENNELKKRIYILEKYLVKAKTPSDLFGHEMWFKIDEKGSIAFGELCRRVRKSEGYNKDLKYELNETKAILKIIKSMKLTKKLRKEIQQEIDLKELDETFWIKI